MNGFGLSYIYFIYHVSSAELLVGWHFGGFWNGAREECFLVENSSTFGIHLRAGFRVGTIFNDY